MNKARFNNTKDIVHIEKLGELAMIGKLLGKPVVKADCGGRVYWLVLDGSIVYRTRHKEGEEANIDG